MTLPTTLLDLLSNSLVLDNTLPSLSLSSLFALSRTSRNFQNLVLRTPSVFRYLDLSRCRGAHVPHSMKPIDSGGNSWRAQRMDENLTEDDFYSGPLRGVLSFLSRRDILRDVHTLVLDGLVSATNDLVYEIVTSSEYNVKILSVLRCVNLNQRKLQQLLCTICRPSRPEGTPRLQGMYVFGTSSPQHQQRTIHEALIRGVTLSEGAQLGSLPSSSDVPLPSDTNPWYAPTGRTINEGHAKRSSWEETLQVCRGIIAFDAVLCTNMHAAMAPYLHVAAEDYLSQHKPGISPLATIALGPEGCAGCGTAPADAPVWGETDCKEFPLLHPPPFSGKLIDACRPPRRMTSHQEKPVPRRFIASCTWCLANRHCESCHRWWCGDCYDPKQQTAKLKNLQRLQKAGLNYLPSREELSYTDSNSQKSASVKVYNNLCVENCLVGEMMAGAGSGGMWG